MGAGSHGGFRYDFAVYNGRGHLSALLEAKRRFGTDPAWARAWHAAIVERPADVNIVLIAPDRIYAWRPGAAASADPDWTLDAGPWLAPYFARLKIPATEVHPHVFETIVELWLHDVVRGELPEGVEVEGARDLLEALRGGEVVQQVAA